MELGESMFTPGEVEFEFPSDTEEAEEKTEETPEAEIEDILAVNKEKEKEEIKEEEESQEEELDSEQDTPSHATDDTSVEVSESQDSSSSPYKSFAKASYEEGVLSEFSEEEFDKLVEEKGSDALALIELNKRTIQGAVQEYKDSLPDRLKDIISRYEDGIPLSKIVDNKVKEEKYDSYNESEFTDNADLQKKVVKEDLMNRGLTDEESEEEISLYYEVGELEKRAKSALKRLKEAQKKSLEADKVQAEKDRLEREQETQKVLASIKSDINATKELIPGIEVSTREKENMFKLLTEIVDKDQSGRPVNKIVQIRSKNPMAFDKTLAYLTSMGVFNLNDDNAPAPDWSKIAKVSKSKAIEDFEKSLEKTDRFKPGKARRAEPESKDTGPGSFIRDLQFK